MAKTVKVKGEDVEITDDTYVMFEMLEEILQNVIRTGGLK